MAEMKDMLLYHGSYCIVKKPSLDQCVEGKDFGRGFYLTTSQKQAERFCRTAVGKALKNGKISEIQNIGYVNIFHYVPENNLSVFDLPKPTAIGSGASVHTGGSPCSKTKWIDGKPMTSSPEKSQTIRLTAS